jgi:5'-deoxynucleotidase
MKPLTSGSSFIAYLSKLRWIQRWGLKRNAYAENVMEHSWEVAVIAHTLALIKNRFYGGTLDANLVATTALYHDASEVITGDLPTPIKYHSSEILNAYKNIEKLAEKELLQLLPDELKPDFEPFLLHHTQSQELSTLIKSADRISAYLKCQAELKAGNLEFEIAEKRIIEEIRNCPNPEVHHFMDLFVPSCNLTLDDLIPRI